MSRSSRFVWAVLLYAGTALGQVATEAFTSGGSIQKYQPVQTMNGNQIIPQSGTAPVFGIAQETVTAAGMPVTVAKYGTQPVLFDGPVTSAAVGLVAYPVNGYGHWDAATTTDNLVNIGSGTLGRIMGLLPALGPNYAAVNFEGTARRGAGVLSSNISDSTRRYWQSCPQWLVRQGRWVRWALLEQPERKAYPVLLAHRERLEVPAKPVPPVKRVLPVLPVVLEQQVRKAIRDLSARRELQALPVRRVRPVKRVLKVRPAPPVRPTPH